MPDTGSWDFRPGPVFAHVVLVDELNRTPPRTQSALLETMEERQVSVDGQSWPLPQPHLVIATQNPHSQRGTFPLVESQLDRFAMATPSGTPTRRTRCSWRSTAAARTPWPSSARSARPRNGGAPSRPPSRSPSQQAVAAYAVELCRASRTAPGVHLGASPRAAIWLIRAAQAHAVLDAQGLRGARRREGGGGRLPVPPHPHRRGRRRRRAVGRGDPGAPRNDARAETVSRWARPARPRAPMAAAVVDHRPVVAGRPQRRLRVGPGPRGPRLRRPAHRDRGPLRGRGPGPDQRAQRAG